MSASTGTTKVVKGAEIFFMRLNWKGETFYVSADQVLRVEAGAGANSVPLPMSDRKATQVQSTMDAMQKVLTPKMVGGQ